MLDTLTPVAPRAHRGADRGRQTRPAPRFDAWTCFCTQDENASNAIVSEYVQGAWVALALDLTIRAASDNQQSLDAGMRALWPRHGGRRGVPEDGSERLAAAVTGLALTASFETALRSTRVFDLAALLAGCGIERAWQPAPTPAGYVAVLGAVWTTSDELGRVPRVRDDGPAPAGGLAPGDRTLAVNGLHVRREALATRTPRLPRTRPVTFHGVRGDRLLERPVPLRPAPRDTAHLRLSEQADAAMQRRRAAWLDRP